jgi:hypothetical protein
VIDDEHLPSVGDDAEVKQSYEPPVLAEYGTVATLTAKIGATVDPGGGSFNP